MKRIALTVTLAAVFLLWTTPSPVSAGDLVGRVLNKDGTPAANKGITLFGPRNESGETNANGYFSFRNLPGGTYTLRIDGRTFQVQVPGSKLEINRDFVL